LCRLRNCKRQIKHKSVIQSHTQDLGTMSSWVSCSTNAALLLAWKGNTWQSLALCKAKMLISISCFIVVEAVHGQMKAMLHFCGVMMKGISNIIANKATPCNRNG
jgi:hypothetical protein